MAPCRSTANDLSVKLTTIDLIGGIYCTHCQLTFKNKKDYDEHYTEHGSLANITYTCVVCHKEFNNYASFRGHCYTAHIIKNRFQCKTCNKFFSKQAALIEHEETQHKFKCRPPCNKEFLSKTELQVHQMIHKENGPPYPCHLCEDTINSVDECEQHVEMHSVSSYPCPICDTKLNAKSEAVHHITQHFEGETPEYNSEDEEEKPLEDSVIATIGIECYLCSKNYKSKREFDQHFVNEHDCEIVYTCHMCGRIFELYKQLNSHLYYHVRKQKFKCDSCAQTFNRLSLLVQHTALCEETLDTRSKPFICIHCDAGYASETTLKTHLRLFHAEKKLHCHLCGVSFKKGKDLAAHYLTHKDARICRHCGLELKSLASCEKHLDVHRKVTYTCPICKKKNCEKYYANKHISLHFQSEFHICKICGKVYSAKYRLLAHMKFHADVKTFECGYCGKGFVGQLNYEQHINTHMGIKPYQCPECPRAFTSYPNWFKHVQRIHSIDPKSIKKMAPKNLKAAKNDKNHNNPNVVSAENKNPAKVNEKINTVKQIPDNINTVAENKSESNCIKNEPAPQVQSEFELIDDVDDASTTNMIPDIIDRISDDTSTDQYYSQNLNIDIPSSVNTASCASPNMLEEAYNYVQSLANEQNIELECIEPSVLENVPNIFESISSERNGYSQYINVDNVTVTDLSSPQNYYTHEVMDTSPLYSEYGAEINNYPTNISFNNNSDPMLAADIQFSGPTQNIIHEVSNTHFENDINANLKWDYPIIKKICTPYDPMADVGGSILSVIQNDIY